MRTTSCPNADLILAARRAKSWREIGAERTRVGGYAEYLSPRELAHIIECSWVHVVGYDVTGAPWHRVLPDDAVGLAFTCARDVAGRVTDAYLGVLGPVRTPRRYAIVAGREMVAVKLRAEWSTSVFGAFPGDHTDSYDDAAFALPRLDRGALDRLSATHHWAEALAELWTLVDGLVRTCGGSLTTLTSAQRAVSELRRAPRRSPVDWTARALGVSSRHLRRVVLDGVGAAPHELRRTWRFLRALSDADACERPRWAAIAAAAGYADQAHLVREFRLLTGLTPELLMRERKRE